MFAAAQTTEGVQGSGALPAVDFKDIAQPAGLMAINVSGNAEQKHYILETTGDGVGIFDFDNDGLMDVFLVNATTMDGKGRGEKSTSHLYRNLGNLHFEDLTEKAGLGKVGWGQGVCVGDYDNDGYEDMFVTYFGHSVLYHNEGNGTFKDVTEAAGLKSDTVRWHTGCSFVDYDLDGKLDLASPLPTTMKTDSLTLRRRISAMTFQTFITITVTEPSPIGYTKPDSEYTLNTSDGEFSFSMSITTAGK